MRSPLPFIVIVLAALLAQAAPALANDPVVDDGCGEDPAVPDASWDLDRLDIDGAYEIQSDGTAVLEAIDVAFTLCAQVADRPAPTSYIFGWAMAGTDCGLRLHVSDEPGGELIAVVQEICPFETTIGLSQLSSSRRVPGDQVVVDGRTVSAHLPLDGVLAGLSVAPAAGTVLTDTRATVGPGVVNQDGDSLEEGTVNSYPFLAMDHGDGRDVVLGEDRPS